MQRRTTFAIRCKLPSLLAGFEPVAFLACSPIRASSPLSSSWRSPTRRCSPSWRRTPTYRLHGGCSPRPWWLSCSRPRRAAMRAAHSRPPFPSKPPERSKFRRRAAQRNTAGHGTLPPRRFDGRSMPRPTPSHKRQPRRQTKPPGRPRRPPRTLPPRVPWMPLTGPNRRRWTQQQRPCTGDDRIGCAEARRARWLPHRQTVVPGIVQATRGNRDRNCAVHHRYDWRDRQHHTRQKQRLFTARRCSDASAARKCVPPLRWRRCPDTRLVRTSFHVRARRRLIDGRRLPPMQRLCGPCF